MTKIAIFCDGTWNSPTRDRQTHVRGLHQALKQTPGDQVSVYFKGIGTDDRFHGPVRRFANRYGGGVFGWGLDAKVKEAYQFLAQAYSTGDEIYLFGFSRGAFTARSVAGMIRKCGIVKDTSTEGINAAFKLYRKGGRRNHPDKSHILRARRAMSPDFATSQADLDWRGDTSKLVNLAYLGVWDTVGARGVPVAVLGPLAAAWNAQYRFHDMELSSLVRAARHAVGVDEQRVFYKPALWDNLDRLNGAKATAQNRPYQQVWFVGNHAIIGGSGDAPALSAFTLDWIKAGAPELKLKPGKFPPTAPDALAKTELLPPQKGLFKAWRSGPQHHQDLDASVKTRVHARSDYRPNSLHRLF